MAAFCAAEQGCVLATRSYQGTITYWQQVNDAGDRGDTFCQACTVLMINADETMRFH